MKTLGIDTSNYTTSVSVCADGMITENIRIPLPVSEGGVGLRQSDAVFAHIKNIPIAMERLEGDISDISAVGVSARPRDVEGSYMPCFLSGGAMASSIARTLNVPLYEFSHQAGHIRAAVYSSGAVLNDEFFAYHLSGGTFELLKVIKTSDSYMVEKIGGTKDVTAGQLIDRIGVRSGLSFPCGRQLEITADEYKGKLPKPKVCVNGLFCNMSGAENICDKMLRENEEKAKVYAFLTEFIRSTLEKMTDALIEQNGKCDILFSGGVSSNKTLARFMKEKYGAHCAEPQFSQDNGAGIALLCMEKINGNEKR